MSAFLGIAETGVRSVLQYPARSGVVVACVVAVLAPYLAGLGLSRGIQAEAEDAIRFGADLYVVGNQFGRDVPLPIAAAGEVRKIDAVQEATPRIVGAITLGSERVPAVLVGMPPGRVPKAIDCVEGRLPAAGPRHELAIGTELARRLRLRVGDVLPPFYRTREGERLAEVVGIFRSDVSLWQSHLVFATFDAAGVIFDQPGLATDILVFCRPGPGYPEQVRRSILESVRWTPAGAAEIRPRVTLKQDLEAILPRGLLHREGIFNMLFVLAFGVAILAAMTAAGFGSAGRRREIGILKATGWQTDEVLLRGAVESVLLSAIGGAVSLLIAYVWLEWLNGYGIASTFLADVDAAPSFKVPYLLAPIPTLLAFVISLTVVLTGTLYASWRAATTPPREAIRSAR